MEVFLRKKDGSPIEVSMTVSPIMVDGGEIRGISVILRDVTRIRREQQETLIKDHAISSSITGIGIADLDGRITFANRAFLRMFGYGSPADIMGFPIEQFAHSEAVELRMIEKVKRALLTSGGWTGETRPKRKDGTLFDAHLSASLVSDQNGRPLCMMAAFIDITERKNFERDLRLKESALMYAGNGILITNRTGTIVYANQAFLDRYGYDLVEGVLYRPLGQVVGEGSGRVEFALESLKEGASWSGILPVRKKDHSVVHREITAHAISDRGGMPTHTVFSIGVEDAQTPSLEKDVSVESGTGSGSGLVDSVLLTDATAEATDRTGSVTPLADKGTAGRYSTNSVSESQDNRPHLPAGKIRQGSEPQRPCPSGENQESQHMRTLMSMGDPVAILDPAGRIREVNTAMLEALGVAGRSVTGRHIVQFAAPEQRRDLLLVLRNVARGQCRVFRYSLLGEKGRVQHEVMVSPVRDTSGDFVGYVLVYRATGKESGS
jgi:PAS domain S-box-containing protein